jgi:hypothetical protein
MPEAVHWFLMMTAFTALLDGLTLKEAVNQERLFFQDYHSVLADDIAPQVLFTGPCLSSVIWLLYCHPVLNFVLHFMLMQTGSLLATLPES